MTAQTKKPGGWGAPVPKGLSGRNILPRTHAPLRTFMVAMAVMTYLAAVAIGGMFMTWRAIQIWKSGVVAEATVQILPLSEPEQNGGKAQKLPATDMNTRVQQAVRFLEKRPEVKSLRVLTDRESRALLQPWLGDVSILQDVPLPRLIAIRLNPERKIDIAALDRALRAAVPGARLDAHGRWVRALSHMASTVFWLGLGILAAIIIAAVVLVVHAARAALESNRETIEVLHLVGARDSFIARQVQRLFLRAGFLAGMLGVAAAWLTFALLALLAPAEGIREGAWQLLFGAPEKIAYHYGAWLIIVLAATTISLLSARTAAMRILAEMFAEP